MTEADKPGGDAWKKDQGLGGSSRSKASLELEKGQNESLTEVVDGLKELGYIPNVSEDVHHATMKSFVKEQLEKGNTELPKKEFGVYEFTKAKITTPKQKKSKK